MFVYITVIKFLTNSATLAEEEVQPEKFHGNRKKLKAKQKAIPDNIHGPPFTQWPASTKLKEPYIVLLSEWVAFHADWPEGLSYGTDDFGDREIVSDLGDEDLVVVLDRDIFGNHSMQKVYIYACTVLGDMAA